MMHGSGKSDRSIVPEKFANKALPQAAEGTEGRDLAKGNLQERNAPRTQSRTGEPSALERVRQAARKDRKQRFTALFHHVYDIDQLRRAYLGVKREAAAGVDGVTWRQYGERREENLQDLSGRLRRGAYRAKPARRSYVPKAEGKQRPIGVVTLEDKVVQRAVVEVLNAIYEEDFLGFSYGYRPGRDPHQALEALRVALMSKKVSWVFDADIRAFFDKMDRRWLKKFIEHRIGDRRIVRLVQKWLNAGVLEEGRWTRTEEGTVQGGSISPLLANLYLHHVFDLWVHHWRRTRAKGDVEVVRFADDIVVGFQYRNEAEQFWEELRERFAKFEMELHPEKTRLIEFGRFADQNREERGEGRPETFNFLGFTHRCGKTRKGKFRVDRETMRQRWQGKLREVYAELRRRMHTLVPTQGSYLRSVVVGHVRYYGVPGNGAKITAFRHQVGWLWYRALKRRSQKHSLTWDRMKRLIARWIPLARVCRPRLVSGLVATT
jgi:group II intron reverse transcriptase/maturase